MSVLSFMVTKEILICQLALLFGSHSIYFLTQFPYIILLQYDAFDMGFITTDDFTNADILDATYPAVAKRLHGDWITDPAIPVVTGFLGKVASCCICILVYMLSS